jgi:alpha-methylacyl-CoA racemase
MGGGAPLEGTSALVFAGLGPVPYAAMLLADLGCAITVVDRPAGMATSMPPELDPRRRGQRSVAVDLRTAAGKLVGERLVRASDVVVEGMRPGVLERLGLGPQRCLELNPAIIYARITGWGQTGPYAQRAGHDINYIGLTGALLAMGNAGSPPTVPLNLLGDYAGGGVFAVLGVLAALLERERSGRGQVIDCSILESVMSLCTATIGMRNAGLWGERGTNAFDGSRPWYRTYETADGGYVAVGAIEPVFFRELLTRLDMDPAAWPRETPEDIARLAEKLEAVFRTKTRDDWTLVFADADACVTPVLSFAEALLHEQVAGRHSVITRQGQAEPAPAPRFERTPGRAGAASPGPGQDTAAVLAALGYSPAEVDSLRAEGAVR